MSRGGGRLQRVCIHCSGVTREPGVTLVLCRYREYIEGFKEWSRSTKFEEHYSQAQLFYAPYKKAHLVSAFSFELSHCDDPVVYKNMSVWLSKIDDGLAWQVALNVGGVIPEPVDTNHKQMSAGLSQRDFAPKEAMIVMRRIAILITYGVNAEEVKWLRHCKWTGSNIVYCYALPSGNTL
jgi:catalase